MGNKSVTPAFSYDTVCSALSAEELGTLRAKFKMLCRNDRAGGTGLLDLNAFINKVKEHTCNHLVEQFLPRLFYLIAGGRDARTLRFEDYIGAVALFRLGTKEEKLKFVYLLYDPAKGTAMSRENFQHLLVDANVIANNDGLREVTELDSWLNDMSSLISLQLTNIFAQFASSKDRMTFTDFMAYIAQENQPAEDLLPYILKVLEL